MPFAMLGKAGKDIFNRQIDMVVCDSRGRDLAIDEVTYVVVITDGDVEP